MLTANQVTITGDSVLLTQDERVVMRAAWHGTRSPASSTRTAG
jgi:hypothetical protein